MSFEKLFSLTPYLDNPAAARIFMVRWALLQLLIGNSGDAHGKNLSFFVNSASRSGAHTTLRSRFDQHIRRERRAGNGDAFRLEDITAFALANFAHRTGIRPLFLAREMTRMAQAALKFSPEQAGSDVYIDEERVLVQQVSDFVCAQANRLLQLAPMVLEVDSQLL